MCYKTAVRFIYIAILSMMFLNLCALLGWQQERIRTEKTIQNNIQTFQDFSDAVKEVSENER
jgi:hypothetical protein